MITRNKQFYDVLKKDRYLKTRCNIYTRDAQNTKLKSNSTDLIISSPPYVTSYEYADIHQLTGYWYNYIKDMNKFRKKFIGTFYSNNNDLNTNSKIAKRIIDTMEVKHRKFAREIANYFNSMNNVFAESKRILKNNGRVCFVIGNTTIRGVKIKNAEVFYEMLIKHGFEIEDVILREIPFKYLTPYRDKITGKFGTKNSENSKLVYPEEYIIIAKKL
jgi:tRNA G10  N-methylase Trm11